MHVVDALVAIDEIAKQMNRMTALRARLPAGLYRLLQMIPVRITSADRLYYFAASLIGTAWEDVLKETFVKLSSAVRKDLFMEAIRMQDLRAVYFAANFPVK